MHMRSNVLRSRPSHSGEITLAGCVLAASPILFTHAVVTVITIIIGAIVISLLFIAYVIPCCCFLLQDPVSSPDYLRSTVMIVCLLVVLRMIFSFAWFFYMFMYVCACAFIAFISMCSRTTCSIVMISVSASRVCFSRVRFLFAFRGC